MGPGVALAKVLSITYKALNGIPPSYISDL